MARKAASLELAVLGLLHESPLHGYELRKRLNLLLGWGRLLSYGSLYPALKRLLRAGWITEVTAESPGVSRRQRIVYQITPAGRQFFIRLRILEGRRSRLQERLDRARYAAGGDDRYLSELRRHSIESVEREVRWLTDLINAERSNDQPGRVDDAPVESGDVAGPDGTTPESALPVIDAAADATTTTT